MSHAPTSALERRHERIRENLTSSGFDALVVTSLPNVLYLTNFTGSSAIVVVTADRLSFLTDFRYLTSMEQARGRDHACPNLELVRVEGSYDAALAAHLGSLACRRIGFEAAHLSVSRHAWLDRTLGQRDHAPELVATEGVIERARLTKDEYEIATLREAARRLSTVARGVFDEIRPGRSERDVAFAVDARLHDAGFSKPAFDTIVASGPNAALPHAHPGERTFAEGDLVVLDFGGIYDSYCVHAAVRQAHDRAIAAVSPGRSRFDIDAAARETLGTHGLADAFGHGTGHGLGIEVHEDPRITRRRPDVDTQHEAVAPGMVFTIEPGAYLAGWGGVRIEDDVLVTAEGAEVLTDVTTELLEI